MGAPSVLAEEKVTIVLMTAKKLLIGMFLPTVVTPTAILITTMFGDEKDRVDGNDDDKL